MYFLKIIPISIFVLISNWAIGQALSIKGQLINEQSEAQAYATVSLHKDTTLVEALFTDNEGHFGFNSLQATTYILSYHSLGYEDRQDTIELSSCIDLKEISLHKKKEMLDEVVISEYKSLQQGGVEKIVFNITDDLRAANATASDLFERLPMVDMDLDGVPSVIGKNGVVVLVDGKEPKIKANNVADVLRTIPTDMILKVELMRNPPLKYTRDNSAVLNIITNRKPQKGYNSNFRLSYNSFQQTGGNFSFNWKHYKWTISTYVGKWNWYSKRINTSTSENFLSEERARLENSTENIYTNNGFYGGAGVEYAFTPKTNLALYLNLSTFKSKSEATNTSNYYDEENNLSDFFISENNSNHDNVWKGLWFSFDTEFKKKGHSLEVSAYFGQGLGNVNSEKSYTFSNYRRDIEKTTSPDDIYGDIEIEYYYPINDKSNFEAGIELSLDHSKNKYNDMYSETNGSGLYTFIQFQDDDINDQEAYISYNKNWGKLTTIFGMSYTLKSMALDNIHYTTNKNYSAFKPQIALTYKIGALSKVGLTYNLKEKIPDAYQFEHYIDYTDNYESVVLNTDLKKSKNQNVELNYSTYAKNINIGLTAFYDYTDKPVKYVFNVDPDGIKQIGAQNVGFAENIGTTLSLSGAIAKKIRYSFNTSLSNQRVKGTSNIQKNLKYTLGGSLNFPLFGGITSSFRTKYTSGIAILDGTKIGYFTSSLSLKKLLLKKKMTVSLDLKDIFGNRKIHNEILRDSFHSITDGKDYTQKFTINISYRFGTIKEIKTKNAKSGK